MPSNPLPPSTRWSSPAAATLLLLLLGLAVPGGAADWPTFLGPHHDGSSRETGIRTDWSGGLPIVWQTEVGEGYSMASVADGRLFFFDRVGDEARLMALDAATGKLLWESRYPTDYTDYYDYSGGPRASPVVDGERVYAYGVEGRLRCHDVTDGTVLWEVDTAARFGVVKNFFGVGSTPVVEGDLLITMVGGSPPGTPKIHSEKVVGNGTGLVAFDKRSGEVRWKASDELASYATPRLVDIGDRRWGFAFARGGLLGFEPRTGRVDFHFPWRAKILESVNASTPVVVGDTVFLSETYGPGSVLLRVADGAEPEVVWKDPRSRREQSLQTHWNTPIYHDGHLYASSGRNSGDAKLRCVEHATGKVKWSERGLTRSMMLAVDGHLVVLTEYGRLLLVKLDPESYQLVTELELTDGDGQALLKHPAWNAPVLANRLLYVRGKDRLVALELIPSADAGSGG